MKRCVATKFISTALLVPWIFLACAESQSVEKTESQTCINGSCTTTTTESRSSNSSVSSGVSVGGGVNVSTHSGGVNPVVVVSIGGSGSAPSSSSGGVNLTACNYKMAPLSACSAAGAGGVISPKHLGCTASGNHAWSCQDSFSAAPPYPVVACSGAFSDSCGQIGVIY